MMSEIFKKKIFEKIMSTKFFVKTNLVRHVVATTKVVSFVVVQTLVSITFGQYASNVMRVYGLTRKSRVAFIVR